MVDHYVGVLGIAEAMGVTRHAVGKWRSRYPAGSTVRRRRARSRTSPPSSRT
ncbi:hypothetical protein ACFQV8_05675 [Pseudonocardia benzenivorans]